MITIDDDCIIISPKPDTCSHLHIGSQIHNRFLSHFLSTINDIGNGTVMTYGVLNVSYAKNLRNTNKNSIDQYTVLTVLY